MFTMHVNRSEAAEGVAVGIADKNGRSNAACGPRTRKSGGQLTPETRGSAAPEIVLSS